MTIPKKQLLELYEQHGSGAKVAEVVGVTSQTVNNWLRGFGVVRPKLTKESIEEVLRRHETKKAAAEELGMSLSGLCNLCKRRGITDPEKTKEWCEFLYREPKIGQLVELAGTSRPTIKRYTFADRWFYTKWRAA